MNLRQETRPIDFGREAMMSSVSTSPRLADLLFQGKVEVVDGEKGSFLLIDDASLIEGGQPSAELQAAIAELRAHGADVVILTSTNPDGLETTVLRDQMTAANGLGSHGEGTLAPRAIVFIVNTRTVDGGKEAIGVTGDVFARSISQADVSHAIDLLVDTYLEQGSFDAGFVRALNSFDHILDERDARATQQALPQPTSIPATAEPQQQFTPQEIQPSFKEFVETNKTPLAWGAGLSIMLALVGLDHVLARPIREFVKTIESSRGQAKIAYRQLGEKRESGLSAVRAVISGYESSYPDRAAAAREDQEVILAELKSLAADYETLVSERVWFGRAISQSGKDNLNQVRNRAQELRSRSINLARQIEEQMKLAEDLRVREQSARSNVDKVRGLIRDTDGLEDWYDQQRRSFAEILPSREQALSGIYATLESANRDAYLNVEFSLRGSDTALELMETIEHFKRAANALTHAYSTSLSLANDSNPHLQKWPGEAIEIRELINSGVILLNEAKSGIPVKERFDEVIAKSQAAEREFAEAKEFATVTASVLQLRDTNDRQISTIVQRGFREAHIQRYKDRMKQSLAKANVLASQGNWQQAQEQLGIFRVTTNEALAEMERLRNLHEQNNKDLSNLAVEVAKNQQRYDGETTAAWNDLRQNFTSENYDETREIWRELRKQDKFSMTPLAAADLKSHHMRVGKILQEITDDHTDENDIVSQAATANSMEVQRFDRASELIREMEQRLMRAIHMMDELKNRQELANKAKTEYQAAIGNAESRLGLAKQSIANPADDRLVDQVVDEKISQADVFVELAKRAGKASIYVAALEAANRAGDLSIRARKSAEEQIQRLKGLYQQLEMKNKRVSDGARSVMQSVKNELAAVITANTNTEYRNLEQVLAAIVLAESGLAAKEDHALAAAIENILQKLDGVSNQTSSLKSALEADQRSYQRLLDDLQSAIRSADSAISSAAARCNHSDAGSAGRSSLSSARSSNPSMSSRGDSRQSISSKISAAEQAERYAESAYGEASRAISAAEDARRREEQRKRDEERRRQEEQRRREESQRRANESARSFSSGSNQSGRKF